MKTAAYAEPTVLPDLFEETSINLDDALSFDEWARLGQNLLRFARSHQWWVGDWLMFGEDHFGEEAPQAIELLGLEPKTLINYRRVAERIPKRDRRQSLSWTHHRIVADLDRLPARRRILKRAETESLTTRQVQQLVTAEHHRNDPEVVTAPDPHRTTATFTVSFTVDVEHELQGFQIQKEAISLVEAELTARGIDSSRVRSAKS